MGKPTGFIEYHRKLPPSRPPKTRIQDYQEIYYPFPESLLNEQAARCMDCGVPFCQAGCPIGNLIPDFNDLVYRGQWQAAYQRLAATNNFPEFTGRLCPAPCEAACVLGHVDEPVTIEQIEKEIIERAFASGWVVPQAPAQRSGQAVAVVGSGPAGLATADQLNQAGHQVTVFERHDRIGGLLRYGIPDFKLEKHVVERRVALLEAEGITFHTGADIGGNVPVETLHAFDAVVLCGGATQPRDLPVPGRDLLGIHFAWDYLTQQNQRVAGGPATLPGPPLQAADQHVIVIGGGDTGSDCMGTAHRQGAKTVTQFELLPQPPASRTEAQPWPFYPRLFTTTTSHEEGGARHWCVTTCRFVGTGRVKAVETQEVERDASGRYVPIPGTEKLWPADLVLLAIGYTGGEAYLPKALGVPLDDRLRIVTDAAYQTPVPGVFAAGDGRRGQSLIVWAIQEGRAVAQAVDAYLTGATVLPGAGPGVLPPA